MTSDAPKTYAISATPDGNGAIACPATVNSGASATCTITPNTGYGLSSLTDNGANVTSGVTNNSYILLNVSTDHAISGSFADMTKPTGSVTFSGGAYTNLSTATLTLNATDVAGMEGMKFSWDGGSNWSNEEPYGTTRVWNLGTVDGAGVAFVKFKDRAGNWSDPYRYDLTLDTVGPVITLSPFDQCTKSPSQTVSGTVSDSLSGLKKLTINGATVEVNGGAFSHSLTLANGANAIMIAATDNAGVVTTRNIEIALDQTLPVLTVSYPVEQGDVDLFAGLPVIDVKGEVNENAIVTIRVNNADPATVAVLRNAFVYPVSLRNGTNEIEVKAVDCAGNVSTVKRTVAYLLGLPGDLDGSGQVDIADAILAIQVVAKRQPAVPIHLGNEVGGNKKIGMEDVIYILQKVAGVR